MFLMYFDINNSVRDENNILFGPSSIIFKTNSCMKSAKTVVSCFLAAKRRLLCQLLGVYAVVIQC